MKKKFGFIISLLSLGIVFLGIGIFFLVDFGKEKNPVLRPSRKYFVWSLDCEGEKGYASYLNGPIILKEQKTYTLLLSNHGPYYLEIESFVFEYDPTIFEIECITSYDPEYPFDTEIRYSLYCKKKATDAILNIYVSYYENMSCPENYYRTLYITIE